MPTISVDSEWLFSQINDEKTKYTPETFADLCFDFGIELDDFEDGQLKIEIGANRYDMLCREGIATELRTFMGRQKTPNYRLSKTPDSQLQTITVKKEVGQVRPLVAGAILRNVRFDEARYNSFIELQDKIHQNLARQRTLVSIGTHDLDTIQGPFTYEAHPPQDIEFAPLNQTQKFTGDKLMEFYEKDKHLGRYLHIIREAPVYPVIYDANRVVCSLPPIINGDHSKITLNTKNIFIEITATDATKLEIVCNIITCMFSAYCAEPFEIEPVKIVYQDRTEQTPTLAARVFDVEIDYINSCLGLTLAPEEICRLLEKMAYKAEPADKGLIKVTAPCTRADVLHPCDIMEDVGVAYGFNDLPRSSPNKSATIARPLPINKLTDIVRHESAQAGWSEVLNLALCSLEENFTWMNRKDDGKTAVKVGNPKSHEFETVRTSLLPGLLKSLRENRSMAIPIRIMESSDVVLKDDRLERKARNERRWAALYYGKTDGFQDIHGLLDRVMAMLDVKFIGSRDGVNGDSGDGYFLEEINEPTFFPGRAAAIILQQGGKKQRIGEMGILHPTVLERFLLKHVVSAVELNLEVFL